MEFKRGDTISGWDFFWLIAKGDVPIFVKGFVGSITCMNDNPEYKIYRTRNVADGKNYRVDAIGVKSCRLLLTEKIKNNV